MEDQDWVFGRLLERVASPEYGWLPRDFVDPVDEITRREGSESRIAVPSVIRVPECLQVYRTEESRQRQLERGAEPGSDEVRGVNHNLEEEVAKECYIQTRVSGYPTETDGPRPV